MQRNLRFKPDIGHGSGHTDGHRIGNRLARAGRRFGGVMLLLAASACLASTQREVQMGAEYSAQISKQLPLINDPEASRYINLLGDSLARMADDRNLRWSFFIVDQPDINAFAIPGGYVYVNRGLIEKASSMSELAGVMGHEIAHVTQRHSMKQMRKAEGANIGTAIGCVIAPSFCNSGLGSAAIQVGGAATFSKFSRNDESQADFYGLRYVVRAGIDPRGMPAMFRTLLAERKKNPGAMEAWFSSHPMEEDRAADADAEIRKIDPVILQSLTADSPGFQQFKQHLATLPRARQK